MRLLYGLILGLSLISLGSCSNGEEGQSDSSQEGDHVWKEQTDTLDRAKEAEQMLLDSTEQQRRAIEEQGR